MIEVVNMTSEHIEPILDIEKGCFKIPWSRKSMEGELERVERGLAYYFVALVDGEVAGYGGMWHVVTEGHITNIAVAERYRHQGIGNAIVTKMMDKAVELDMLGVTLEVRVSNKAAIGLYKKHGFSLEGLRKEYYDDNREDAYIMWRYFLPVGNEDEYEEE
jgi:ribosomal-protein-alanine N-acetyltransferase